MSNARGEEANNYRPCLIVAHSEAALVSSLSREFRRRGWDVYPASSGPEARRLARLLAPEMVILGTNLPEETGWLTCDKITRETPRVKVFLIDAADRPGQEDFALYAGAVGLIPRMGAVEYLIREVCGLTLPLAG